MKKLLLIGVFCLGALSGWAQRYCVIDSKYILDNIPEYKQAQEKLDSISKVWQQQIDEQNQELDNLYKSYQAEEVMLTEDLKKKRQDEIMQKEKAVKDLQNERFGYEGDLFKLREQLIKPIQDRVYNAVQQLAAERSYDFVLDKAGGISVFYADPKLDKSNDVLSILGIQK
jgi:outer membrane protein